MSRSGKLLPDNLPRAKDVIAEGKNLAQQHQVASCLFLRENAVASEAEYKRTCMQSGRLMLHAQIGYRDPEFTRDAWERTYYDAMTGDRSFDRYGVCLDWSMGYRRQMRPNMPKGTGLVLTDAEAFSGFSDLAPVAAHFGDFVLGMPAAVENSIGAMAAGCTSVGNIGQYFAFRLPGYDDDVEVTVETVKAIAMLAAQPREILIHSNLDDGFAALFTDLSCSLGAVLIEQYIVDELIGGVSSHCYGHTFSSAPSRLAFQRALARVSRAPGTMVYGNTTVYDKDQTSNYASAAGYLLVDMVAQHALPSGHAINPVPVTEAERIPSPEEVVAAQRFALRLLDRIEDLSVIMDPSGVDNIVDSLVDGAQKFKTRVLAGLESIDVDITDAVAVLLALRRMGARELEEKYGAGPEDGSQPRGRRPLVSSPVVNELERMALHVLGDLEDEQIELVRQSSLTACVATTDVHEFAKILLERIFKELGIRVIDGGVSVDPDVLAQTASDHAADFIALSTYNAVALDYTEQLRDRIQQTGRSIPLYIGGRMNQIMYDDNSVLPVGVEVQLSAAGAIVCHEPQDLVRHLTTFVLQKPRGLP